MSWSVYHQKPRCSCNLCTCPVNTKLNDLDQSIQLTQFLMGLNEAYTSVRGHILMMKPLPTLSQSYAMLLQEESQRDQYSSMNVHTDNAAMTVKSTARVQPKGNFQRKITYSSIICDFCHMPGHLKDKCYCIHGYPSWHKLLGKPKPKPKYLSTRNSVIANVTQFAPSVVSGSETVSAGVQMSHNESLNLSDGQCRQLIHMLQKTMLESQSSNYSQAPSLDNWSSISFAHYSGMAGHFVHQVHSIQSSNPYKWIIDTGATDHVTPYFHLLTDVKTCASTL